MRTFYLNIFIKITVEFCFIGILTLFCINSFSSRFYRNLNLDACLWSFENFYDMSELVEECGGQIVTDGHVKDAVQSHLSIDVPLYVSYIYHSSTDEYGWTDFNHHSSFRLTAVYDTGILWENGVALPEKARLQGKLHPASIIIRKRDKRLQVNFRTKARFRGMFILKTRGNDCLISVIRHIHYRQKENLHRCVVQPLKLLYIMSVFTWNLQLSSYFPKKKFALFTSIKAL